MDTNSKLTDAIRGGDKVAFEALFREVHPRLCLYAESILCDGDEAKDVVQQVFLRLWEKRETIVIKTTCKSYLYRSVYNECIDILKRERVKRNFLNFIRQKEEEDEVEFLFGEGRQECLIREINLAVENLPAQCKEIFLLSRFAGKKSADIANEMSISQRTVETQLYRAMNQLKKTLSGLKEQQVLFFFLFST